MWFAKVSIMHFITLAAILFIVGIVGVIINRKSIINVLISIELMLLAVNINLVAFSAHLVDLVGQIFTIFVLTVAAAEAAIGLAILIVYYKNKHNIEIQKLDELRDAN